MDSGRKATTSQVARALGVKPATVQAYARSGRIPFDVTPGGHRRFDLDEVRTALESRDEAERVPRYRHGGCSPGGGSLTQLISSSGLTGWKRTIRPPTCSDVSSSQQRRT